MSSSPDADATAPTPTSDAAPPTQPRPSHARPASSRSPPWRAACSGLLREQVLLITLRRRRPHGRLQRRVPAAQPRPRPLRRRRDERGVRPHVHARAAAARQGRRLASSDASSSAGWSSSPARSRSLGDPLRRTADPLGRARVRRGPGQARADDHADPGDVPVPHAGRRGGGVHGDAERAAALLHPGASRRRCSTSARSSACSPSCR